MYGYLHMPSTRVVFLFIFFILVLFGGMWYFLNTSLPHIPTVGQGGGPFVLPSSNPTMIVVPLKTIDQYQLNQSGTATLSEQNGQVIVSITVNPINGVNNQPAHIHTGTCPKVGDVVIPLQSVVNGKSVTNIANMTLAKIRSLKPLAINIHKSNQNLNVSTSCGNLPE